MSQQSMHHIELRSDYSRSPVVLSSIGTVQKLNEKASVLASSRRREEHAK